MSRLLISIHGSSLHFFMFMSLNKNSYFSSNMYYTFLVRIIFIFRFLLLLWYILQYFMISWHLGNLLIFNIDLIFSHLTEIIISYDNVSIVWFFSANTVLSTNDDTCSSHGPDFIIFTYFSYWIGHDLQYNTK